MVWRFLRCRRKHMKSRDASAARTTTATPMPIPAFAPKLRPEGTGVLVGVIVEVEFAEVAAA